MNKLIKNVKEWGDTKNITSGGYTQTMAQLGKVKEELFELEEAIEAFYQCHDLDITHFKKELQLEFGDLLVTIIMTATNIPVSLEKCLQMAYDKISKRTGQTIDGVFVKDA